MGEQKPLGKSPLRGNPSPEWTYLPTSPFSTGDKVREACMTHNALIDSPMILNLISSHNSVSWHFPKQHGNLYMTAKSIFENSNLLKNPFLIWHCTH